MKLTIQTPRKFLNPLLSQKSVVSTDVDAFKLALGKYVQDVQQQKDTKQTETTMVAGALMPFLQASPLGFNCRPYSQKGQSGIDLAILSGKDVALSGNDVAVIIEAKVVGSKDMITTLDLNKKAFHEAIFYFMQEREKGNDKIAHIVITDFYQWFVFDAKDFDSFFWRNTQLKKVFHAYHAPNLLTNTTKEVYEAIGEELPKIFKDLYIEESIDCAYFNLAAPASIKDKELTAIYKLLSADNLLKAFNPNDANSLNREFYNELLYILGLEEVKDGGKRLIRPAGTAGSLYDGIADKLDQNDAPHAFEDVIKLIIIWINRILFLKLLESQIVTWTGNKTSRFLSADKIRGYDALENLFFDTLARRIPDRKNKGFDYIPYLNSSLFEKQDEEKAGISISALPDGAQIAYYGKTVVKDAATKRKSGQTSTLAYLFEFLDAYDFANDNDDEVREETKSLISASVLGLIFEKINGYKDGSFYTPSFVTMYMARQTIEKAVLQKFNEAYSWTCTALTGEGGLKNQLKDHKVKKTDSNALIDSLKICDPAVGSGHFLVSALNEILYIKSLLGLLVDEAGNILDYDIVIENDELIVTSDKGELFEYKKGSKEKTLVQKTLFQEKQKIIENCLFGVDINPNSVNICRLRLWIELLKNAYYQPNGELETLPNIDINIKCGNSLISRFALDTDLKDALKKSKISVDEYRTAVSNYRNTSDKAEKKKIESLIIEIKSKFSKNLQERDPNKENLIFAISKLRMLDGQDALFEESTEKKKETRKLKVQLNADITKYEIAIADLETNKIYDEAFEWRLEFPEVLDQTGNFIGFDVVIGNPPYIDIKGLDANYVGQLFSHFSTAENRINLYSLFIELGNRILKKYGEFRYIMPNSILMNSSYSKIRSYISKQTYEIVKLPDNVFSDSDAKVETIILAFCKDLEVDNFEAILYKNDAELEEIEASLKQNMTKAWWAKTNTFNVYLSETIQNLLLKTFENKKTLDDLADFTLGITPYDKYRGHTQEQIQNREFHSKVKVDDFYKPLISGENIQKYLIDTTPKEFIKYGSWLGAPREERFFTAPRVIVRQIVSGKPLRIFAGYTEAPLYFTQIGFSIIPKKHSNLQTKYLTTLLNSKLLNFIHSYRYLDIEKELFQKILIENCKNFPIIIPSQSIQNGLSNKLDAILLAKVEGVDTSKLEREIDDMVYRLYGLTYDEVLTIEPEYSPSREEYEAVA